MSFKQSQKTVESKMDLSPPSSNTGGKSPDYSKTAFVDWLTCTFKFELCPMDFGEHVPLGLSLNDKLYYLSNTLFFTFGLPKFPLELTNKGRNGYKHSIKLGLNGAYGSLDFGGESQRGTVCLTLNGVGCSLVKDWNKVKHWGETFHAKITRCDPAYDDFEGQTVTVALAEQWYDEGLFTSSGRPPNAKLVDDKGSAKGKTLYVGDRKSGKLSRVYEKGKQLGDRLSPWVRVEVELHNKDRVIPWDIVINPGLYLAGSYPCLSFLSLVQCRIKTIKKAAAISYKKMVDWGREAVGKLINVMMDVNQGDYVSVVDQLLRDGVPRRLEPYSHIGFGHLGVAA
jgi:phage replication initiation protein